MCHRPNGGDSNVPYLHSLIRSAAVDDCGLIELLASLGQRSHRGYR